MVGIVYYNSGNLQSVRNAFQKIGVPAEVVTEPEELKKYDRLLLPGVGAFGDAMEYLRARGLDEGLKEFAKLGRPLLGVCLGMQLLFQKSYEFGEHEGLGLLPGEVVPFNRELLEEGQKIPHIGWNRLFQRGESPLLKGVGNPYLYFVHSYHISTGAPIVIGETKYGYHFPSGVQFQNIYGLQPHPEKSHWVGLKILENFCQL